jgi:hypothetical protein
MKLCEEIAAASHSKCARLASMRPQEGRRRSVTAPCRKRVMRLACGCSLAVQRRRAESAPIRCRLQDCGGPEPFFPERVPRPQNINPFRFQSGLISSFPPLWNVLCPSSGNGGRIDPDAGRLGKYRQADAGVPSPPPPCGPVPFWPQPLKPSQFQSVPTQGSCHLKLLPENLAPAHLQTGGGPFR